MTNVAGKTITLKDADGLIPVVQEGESCNIVCQLRVGDQDILKASLQVLEFTLYDETTLAVINAQNGVNILDANGGTVSASGEVTMRLESGDSAIVGTPAAGDLESHLARFTWNWNDGVAANRSGHQEMRFFVQKNATPVP